MVHRTDSQARRGGVTGVKKVKEMGQRENQLGKQGGKAFLKSGLWVVGSEPPQERRGEKWVVLTKVGEHKIPKT